MKGMNYSRKDPMVSPPSFITTTSLGSLDIRPNIQFAADSYVHTPLPDTAPIDVNSTGYVLDLTNKIRDNYQHMDATIVKSPIYVVGSDVPTVPVSNALKQPDGTIKDFPPLDAKWSAVPIPDDFYTNTNPAVPEDEIQCIYQPSTDTIWEFWWMSKTGTKVMNSSGVMVDGWQAAWGGRMDSVSTNKGFWITDPVNGATYGANATGIPHLAGIMTIQELQIGVINHPLGFAVPNPSVTHRFPAQRGDGGDLNPLAVQEGMVMRFPYNLDLTTLSLTPFALMICKAIQKYGMVCWDWSGVCGFRLEGFGNPGVTYIDNTNPYWSLGGILACPTTVKTNGLDNGYLNCWPPAHFSNVPWDKLVVVDVSYFNKWK